MYLHFPRMALMLASLTSKKSKYPDIFSIYDEVCCQVEFSPLMEKGVVDGTFLATQRREV